ncbi:MAG: hypothetical protein FWB96_11350 [Defluviitaleaceae bacterium]|nr:hypothetical protein [Defluviitaleaceae bacterium]MCL2263624.1 hypothetical protein [Defluviitaleaceae bacterium]
MRREDELTKHSLEFAVNGYKNNILDWLSLTIKCFEEHGFPLKSVSYDIDYNRYERKSLKTFYKKINEDISYPTDKLYSFSVFSGVTQKYPDTWYYGCFYDEPWQELNLFFDTSFPEKDVLAFYKNYLQVLLNNCTAWTGYSYDLPCNNAYEYGNAFDIHYNTRYKEFGGNWGHATRGVYNHLGHSVGRATYEEAVPPGNKYRHIYKQNLLSKAHMEEKFGKMLLPEWVEKNNYGIIEKIGMENWLWIIPEDKLYELQVIFYDKGLLIGVE